MRFRNRPVMAGLVGSAALALACLVPAGPASATTSCEDARKAAVASALSIGDPGLGVKAAGLCSNPCESIENFYINWSSSLQSAYVEGLILDAFKTCLASSSSNTGQNSGSPTGTTPKKFSTILAPVVSGAARVGVTLKAINGKWDLSAKVSGNNWLLCPSAKKASSVFSLKSNGFPGLPTDGCQTLSGNTSYLKLTKTSKGKYISLCQTVQNSNYYSIFCTKTTAKVTS